MTLGSEFRTTALLPAPDWPQPERRGGLAPAGPTVRARPSVRARATVAGAPGTAAVRRGDPAGRPGLAGPAGVRVRGGPGGRTGRRRAGGPRRRGRRGAAAGPAGRGTATGPAGRGADRARAPQRPAGAGRGGGA